MKFFLIPLLFLALLSYVNGASILFTSSQTFIIPNGVTSVKVLVIGGGGGGAPGHNGGGGAGYLSVGTFSVASGQSVSVTVGQGGTGGRDLTNSNTISYLTAGTASSFGSFISANGGKVVLGINLTGNNGSSGGGGAGNAGNGAAGGMAGSNGYASTFLGGTGQGNYLSLLTLFTENTITAGAGGAGGISSHGGGGGGGGILINGTGISAEDGKNANSGKGGIGYGAGGGAGGLVGYRIDGGNGANGLVYIEYTATVPEPMTSILFGLSLLWIVIRKIVF